MADKIELEVLTPERPLLRETVDEVVLPGSGGELGILPEHTPLITQLQTGVLTYRQGAEKKSIHVSGGFAEVLPDRVSVLADVAEKPEEIDYDRAREAYERLERQLNSPPEGTDVAQARVQLERAITRMQIAAKRPT
jgi:F-type H+-transporting ATPase subunit epsilon